MLKPIVGRRLAICLGVLWLIDGFAQLQTKMFSSQFANQVVSPSAVGQPLFVRGPIHFFVHLFLLNPTSFNSLILVIQIGLGLLILTKASSRIGLKISIFWAIFVWAIGEGFGGLFGFNTNLLMGLPGAAVIYAILAIIALKTMNQKVGGDEHPGYWLIIVWGVIWVLGGIYQLLPSQASLSSFVSMVSGASGQPGWMYSLKFHLANGLSNLMPAGGHTMAMGQSGSSGGYWFVLVVAAAEILIGIGVFMPKKLSSLFIFVGILASVFFWVVGQTLGGYYSGLATDPNTGPLLILVGLVILSFSGRDSYIKYLFRRIQAILV